MDTALSEVAPALAADRTAPEYLTPKEVADALKRRLETVFNWLNVGVTVVGEAGRSRVRLQGVKIGGRWRISPEALARFVRATSGTTAVNESGALPRETEAERKARVARAMQKLNAAGLLA